MEGVFTTQKKDGTLSYRAGITFRGKHISLGSFPTERKAHRAYLDAQKILRTPSIDIQTLFQKKGTLSFEKAITLLNFRDKHIYIKNPIYLFQNYFIYYLNENEELKFDIDDLFYYSNHKILRRGGHYYVNDYGMQLNLINRYGIKNYGVAGKDYRFINDDPTDFRYNNLEIINPYYGVLIISDSKGTRYRARLHVKSNYTIGTYATIEEAAIAYNKAVDLVRSRGLQKNYPENFIESLSPRAYADLYSEIVLQPGFIKNLDKICKG